MDACRACDDFTEMHLFKLVACCQRECEVMDSRYHWLYMCAAAKSVTNSAGAGRRVLEAAAPLLGLPPQGPAYTTDGGGPDAELFGPSI